MRYYDGNTVSIEKNKTSSFTTEDFGLNNDGKVALEILISGSGVVCDFILEVSNSRKEEGFGSIPETLFENQTELTSPINLDLCTNFQWGRIKVFNIVGNIVKFETAIGKKA